MEIPDRAVPWNDQFLDKKVNENLKPEVEKNVVAIKNFWNKDIKIKDKRINDEDFDRYKI